MRNRLVFTALWLAAFGLFAAATTDSDSSSSSSRSALSDAECRRDLQCWGDDHLIEASVYCEDSIERQARHTHEWTTGFGEQIFSRWGWKDESAGTLTYFGDKVRFQNGFGAWTNMQYSCDFDPSGNRVLGVNVVEGRLPQR